MIQTGKYFSVITDYPIAINSPDHYNPFGTKEDNNYNQSFNDKLYQLNPNKPLRILDLGCAGGLSVKKFLEQGHLACGLEGSDYRKSRNMPEWNNCKELFLCDLTKPFIILENNCSEIVETKFDFITAWEFLEHISIDDINIIYSHIKRLLKPNGGWIVSISFYPDDMARETEGKHWGDSKKWGQTPFMGGKGFHHQLVRSVEKWDAELQDNGFVINNEKLKHFNGHFVRGPGINCPVNYTVNRYLEVKHD